MHALTARRAAVVALLCGALPPRALAAPSVDDELDAVRALVAQRQWQAGADAVRAALEAHREDADARPRIAEFEDLLRRCAFGLSGWTLEPVAAIGRGAVRYVPATRAIELRVDPDRADGWTRRADGTVTLDLKFDGDLTVEMPWSAAGDWAVLLSWDTLDGTGWSVEPRAQDHSGGPGRVTRHETGATKAAGDVSAPRSKEPGTVRVVRAGSAIVVWGDKTQLAQVVAVAGRSGLVGLRPGPDAADTSGVARLPALRISGKLAAGAARKLLGGAEEAAFRAWSATSWKRESALPHWVIDLEAASGAWAERIPEAPEVPDAQRALLRDAIRAFFEGDAATLRRNDSALADVALPETVRSLLDALVACTDDRAAVAEERLAALVAAEPRSAVTQAARAFALRRLGREDAALAAAAAALAVDPAYAPARDLCADVAWVRGDLDAMQAALDDAARVAASSRRTSHLRDLLRRARQRPQGKRACVRSGERFSVCGEGDPMAAAALERDLESIRERFEATVRPLPAASRFRAVSIADPAVWETWGGERGADTEGRQAAYVPEMRELLVLGAGAAGSATSREELGAEAFRLFLHRSVDAAPPWLERGGAAAFGSGIARKDAAGGERRESNALTALRETTLVARFSQRFVPTAELVVADAAVFDADPDVLTVQSRALAKALLAPRDPALRGVLARYVDALSAGRTAEAAFHDVLEPVLPAIEAEMSERGAAKRR